MLVELASTVFNLPPLVYVVVGLATSLYLVTRSRVPANIPPFPVRPYPILGHLPMFKADGPVKTFHKWRQTTGDIFSVYIGPKLVVIMNSYPILKEAFVKQGDVFSDRVPVFISKNAKNGQLGIGHSSGPNWKEQRTVSMNILRKFGMGKNFLAEKISEEVEAYLQALSEFKGQPTDLQSTTSASVSNVICAILLGKRFEFDDAHFTKLLALMKHNIKLQGHSLLLDSYDCLKYVPGDLFHAKEILRHVCAIRDHFCEVFIKDNKEAKEEDKVENFINAYFDEINKKEKAGEPTYLDEDNLVIVLSNLFVAGTETTATTLLWAMLLAMHNPDAQQKLYDEIVDVVGTERRPSIQDRPRMNYTNAYIMETQRFNSVLPLGLAHLCNKTVQVAGYTIPKGTTIYPNLDEVLKDAQTWGDPLVFRPERFLDNDNKLTVREEFIPFSLGRRFCMGESLAKAELFLFVTGIFQRFQIKPEDPANLPTLVPVPGGTNTPVNFKQRLIERTE